jgi:hypothetical protein
MMSRCNDNVCTILVCKYNNVHIQHLQSTGSSRARGTQLQLLMNLVIHESCDNVEVYCKSNSRSISLDLTHYSVPSESDATSTKVPLRGSSVRIIRRCVSPACADLNRYAIASPSFASAVSVRVSPSKDSV